MGTRHLVLRGLGSLFSGSIRRQGFPTSTTRFGLRIFHLETKSGSRLARQEQKQANGLYRSEAGSTIVDPNSTQDMEDIA